MDFMAPLVRLAVLADLHGNLPALEAVLAALPPVEGMLVAGDLAGGPWQNEVIERLRALAQQMPLYAIRGNGDEKILALLERPQPSSRLNRAYQFYGSPSRSEIRAGPRFAALCWFADHLTPGAAAFLEALPEQQRVALGETHPLRLVHGSPDSYDELILPRVFPDRFEEIMAQVEEPVLICAHSHEPWYVQRAGRLAFNPGAVSCPLDGRVGAQYALLDWTGARWEPVLFHIPYNLEPVRQGYAECGLLASAPPAREFLDRLVHGNNPSRKY
jgi:predicted phosphodiesterase